MKKLLRYTLLLAFALVTSNLIWNNLNFNQQLVTILKVSFLLAIFELILKPIIKILLLPINFLTLGTFRFFIDTFGLYLSILFINDFRLGNIATNATNFWGITIPSLSFSGFSSFLVSALTLSFLLNIFNLVLSRK